DLYKRQIFYSELICSDGDRDVSIDARTSDAIALAMRTGARIYTTPEIIKATGFLIPEQELKRTNIQPAEQDNNEVDLSRYTVEELNKMMQKAAAREDYERAAEIKNIIADKTAGNPKTDNQ
ncbi:MAG: DUF151 domain-containing protein, partial [Muribaculaceae bacterium]|nr:DUF151 domain-containing protein [Muribaculaceae bacterium]